MKAVNPVKKKRIPNRKKLKKQNHPREVVGYFLQMNREMVRDDFGRIRKMYDKYIRGNAIEKKINTYDGTSSNAFFIDFTEYKPKTKNLTAHKKMQEILKKAADAGIISKSTASSFKLGKITVPVIKGKLEFDGLEYEEIKTKPVKKSRKKPKSKLEIAKEVYAFLVRKGYALSEKKLTMKDRKVLLFDGKTSVIFEFSGGFYYITFENKKDSELFIKPQMVFDATDKKVLIQMLDRMGVKPVKKSSVSTRQYKSKGTKTKVTTIAFRGKKFSITGTITGFTRDAFVNMAKKLGGKFQNHITKDLDILIVGTKPGKTKVAKAKKYGIEIVKFNDFLTIMHDGK